MGESCGYAADGGCNHGWAILGVCAFQPVNGVTAGVGDVKTVTGCVQQDSANRKSHADVVDRRNIARDRGRGKESQDTRSIGNVESIIHGIQRQV